MDFQALRLWAASGLVHAACAGCGATPLAPSFSPAPEKERAALTGTEASAGGFDVAPEPSRPPRVAPYGPGLDLRGFLDVEPLVVRQDGVDWLALASAQDILPLTAVPRTFASGPCVDEAPHLGFESVPRLRLALRAGRVALERETEACWVEVEAPKSRLEPGKPLRKVGPASAPMTISLSGLGSGLKDLSVVLGVDEISLLRGDEPLLTEPLHIAYLGSEKAETGTDMRRVEVVAWRHANRVGELEVTAEEELTGEPGPIGGSREYARKLRWVVDLERDAVTRSLLADMTAPFSGDGHAGSDTGYQDVWRRDFEGGHITGAWSDTLRALGGASLLQTEWRVVARDDSIEWDFAMPDFDRAIRRATLEASGAARAISLAPEVSLEVTAGELAVTIHGDTSRWPLLVAPLASDVASARGLCDARVCFIVASAERAGDNEDDRARDTDRESKYVRVMVSRKTGQALLL